MPLPFGLSVLLLLFHIIVFIFSPSSFIHSFDACLFLCFHSPLFDNRDDEPLCLGFQLSSGSGFFAHFVFTLAPLPPSFFQPARLPVSSSAAAAGFSPAHCSGHFPHAKAPPSGHCFPSRPASVVFAPLSLPSFLLPLAKASFVFFGVELRFQVYDWSSYESYYIHCLSSRFPCLY